MSAKNLTQLIENLALVTTNEPYLLHFAQPGVQVGRRASASPLNFTLDFMPNWIVSIVLLGIAVWRIKRVLKYRNQSIFLNEIGLNWIDRSRLSEAIRIYILIEVLTFSFLPLFPIFSYIDFLHPYLWHIAIAYFGPLFVFALSWFFYYSVKKA